MVQIHIGTATDPDGQLCDLHAWLGWPPATGEGDRAGLAQALAAASVERGMFIGPEESGHGLVATPAEAVLSWTERVLPGPGCAHVVVGEVAIRVELPEGVVDGAIDADGAPAAAIGDIVDEALGALGLERSAGAAIESFWRPGKAALPSAEVTGFVDVVRKVTTPSGTVESVVAAGGRADASGKGGRRDVHGEAGGATGLRPLDMIRLELETALAYQERWRERASDDALVLAMRTANEDEIRALRTELAQAVGAAALVTERSGEGR